MKKTFVFLFYSLCVFFVKAQNTYIHQFYNTQLVLLSEGQNNGKTDILVNADPKVVKKYAPENTFPIATNAFLIKSDWKNILIDAGLGKNLIENLKLQKLTPENIDAIFITHMHGDHIGGMLKDEKPLFPNAEVYISKAEYDYWTSNEEMNKIPENRRNGFLLARKVLDAYKTKVRLFFPNDLTDPKPSQLFPGLTAFATYGHTPGHCAFLFEPIEQKIMIWGDLTHAMAIQMPHPEIAVTYDINPELAVKSRKELLNYVVKNKIPVAGMHITFPGMGTVKKEKEAYSFTPFN